MNRLRDGHRAFLQKMLSIGCAERRNIFEMLREALVLNSDDETLTNENFNEKFAAFAAVINNQISTLNMELRTIASESTGKQCVVLVCDASNQTVRNAGSQMFKKQEIELLRLIVEALVRSEKGTLSEEKVLNLVMKLSTRMTGREVQLLLERLIDARYIEKTGSHLALAPRGVSELQLYLRTEFKEADLRTCDMCKRVVVHSLQCTACSSHFHVFCFAAFNKQHRQQREKGAPRCPNTQCAHEWTSPLPSDTQSPAAAPSAASNARRSLRRSNIKTSATAMNATAHEEM